MKQKPNFIQMTRAPFLSSIIAPLIIGSLAAAAVNDSFLPINFLLVLVIGLGLHIATNVYNDIYDTVQGTDKINDHRNEFSGGSGVLVDYPSLFPKMFLIARISLLVSCFATVALMFFINEDLFPLLWALIVLAAFFSKYYTAKPIKLAYRGWGEISVWFAFGPMAILIAAVSQNLSFNPTIIYLLPLTGLSTLSILLVGQLIDLDADKKTGKLGVAARMGAKATALIYAAVKALLILNIVLVPLLSSHISYWVYLALVPYLIIFPGTAKGVFQNHNNPKSLRTPAKQNVLLHLTYSLLFIIGLLLNIFI